MKTCLLSILLLLSYATVCGQWESLNGPYGSFINELVKNDRYVFAATTAGIYTSADTGKTWQHQSFFGDSRLACLQLDVVDSLMVADALEFNGDTLVRRMFKSADDGDTWTELSRPPVSQWLDIAIIDTIIFAYDPFNLHLWLTRDEGVSWRQSLINHDVRYPRSFHRYGERLFLGGDGELHIYEGDDAHWRTQTIPQSQEVSYVFVHDTLIIVNDYRREDLFVSEDDGVNWFAAPGSQWNGFADYFGVIRDTLYAVGGYEEIYFSSDNGHTWTSRPSKGYEYSFNMIIVDTVMLVGTDQSGITRSTDYGHTFDFSSTGMDAAFVEKLFLYKDELLTGGRIHGVFNFNRTSETWHTDYLDPYFRNTCFDFEVFNGELMMSSLGHVYRFDTMAGVWVEKSPYFSYAFTDLYPSVYGLLLGDNEYNSSGVLDLFNFSGYWVPFDIIIDGDYAYAYAYYEDDEYQYLISHERMARKRFPEAEWTWLPSHVELGDNIYRMYFVDDVIYAIIPTLIRVYHDLYISRDHGETWEPADPGIPKDEGYTGVNSMTEIGDYLVCTTLGHRSGIYYTRKDELNWKPFNDGLPWWGAEDLVADDTYMYGAFLGQGVWRRKISDLDLVSIESSTQLPSFAVYPNPASTALYLKFPDHHDEAIHVRMYNALGNMVLGGKYENGESMDVSLLPGGIYFLNCDTGSGLVTTKVIIHRD